MKRIVRNFSIWIEGKTRKWVVPSAVWTKLDKGDVSARIDLSDIAVKWGTLDPEFVRANLLLRKVEYHANDSGQPRLSQGETS
jgi:hypothetical protein